MQRIALLLELIDDEARLVIDAISRTDVRFADLPLGDVIDMTMSIATHVDADASIVHTIRSDGSIYAGDSQVAVISRPQKTTDG